MLNVGQHIGHTLFECHLGRPAQRGRYFFNICVRNIRFARTTGYVDTFAAEDFNQSFYGLWIAGTQIETFSNYVSISSRKKCLCHIPNIDKVTRLSAVTNDRVRCSGKFLPKEHTKHSTINTGCTNAWTIGVERRYRPN